MDRGNEENTMNKLLIKIPTRERGLGFVEKYITNVTNPDTQIWLTLDKDDRGNYDDIPFPINLDANISIGNSVSKIDAYNRDIPEITEHFDWDVIMVGSDDMWPNTPGFDQIILDDMTEHFPDGDGCLWYNTEDSESELARRYRGRKIPFGSRDWQNKWISMLPIMGRKYYERFGYIYHPSYKSFWCDNEFTKVAVNSGKIKPIDRTIIRHQHPSWDGGMAADSLYTSNNANWQKDMTNFKRREAQNFPI